MNRNNNLVSFLYTAKNKTVLEKLNRIIFPTSSKVWYEMYCRIEDRWVYPIRRNCYDDYGRKW